MNETSIRKLRKKQRYRYGTDENFKAAELSQKTQYIYIGSIYLLNVGIAKRYFRPILI
jgi:hypothetical protein